MGVVLKVYKGDDEVNERYLRIQLDIGTQGLELAREEHIAVGEEPQKIVQIVPVSFILHH